MSWGSHKNHIVYVRRAEPRKQSGPTNTTLVIIAIFVFAAVTFAQFIPGW